MLIHSLVHSGFYSYLHINKNHIYLETFQHDTKKLFRFLKLLWNILLYQFFDNEILLSAKL